MKVCHSVQPEGMTSGSSLLLEMMFTPRQLSLAPQVSGHIYFLVNRLIEIILFQISKSKMFPPPYMLHRALKLPKLIAPLIYAVSVAAGLEILGHEMKGLIQGARNLRQLGIEELGLPLPKLIVVGDQSTGKSSLIEGIRSAIEFSSKKVRFLTNLGEI